MSGTLVCHIVTSDAMIPVEDATVAIFEKAPEGKALLLAARLTDISGKTTPITLETPPVGNSTSPDQAQGWAAVDIVIDHPFFQRSVIEEVQIFPDLQTVQQTTLIPAAEITARPKQTDYYNITPQDL